MILVVGRINAYQFSLKTPITDHFKICEQELSTEQAAKVLALDIENNQVGTVVFGLPLLQRNMAYRSNMANMTAGHKVKGL